MLRCIGSGILNQGCECVCVAGSPQLISSSETQERGMVWIEYPFPFLGFLKFASTQHLHQA